MPLVTWAERFATTIPMVDQQHKRLFSLVNELHDAMKQGKGGEVLGRVMQDLQNYTKTHFRDEEEAMLGAKYPELAAHQQVHRALEAKLVELRRAHLEGKLNATLDTSRFLSDWLQKHILETDMKYVPWVTGKQKAA